MFRTCLHITLVVFALLWKICDPQYVSPGTQKRMKAKLFHMDMELLKDVAKKIKAVNPFRDMYYKSVVFQAGLLMFAFKMQMTRMTFLYGVQYDNVSTIKTDNDKYYKYWQVKKSMERLIEVNKIAMELDLLIDAMEEYDIKTENKTEIYDRMQHFNDRRSGRQLNDNFAIQLKALNLTVENAVKKGGKRNKTGKWHYAGDDGPANSVKNWQKPASK